MAVSVETEAMEAAATANRPGQSRRITSGPDRTSVMLLAIAAFLAVLALLAWQLRSTASKSPQRPAVLLRRIYETTVVETVRGGGSGTSVSQSVSSSGSSSVPVAAPVTRSSSAP
jgi:hypothetical protein